jgi:hypothetical protein
VWRRSHADRAQAVGAVRDDLSVGEMAARYGPFFRQLPQNTQIIEIIIDFP